MSSSNNIGARSHAEPSSAGSLLFFFGTYQSRNTNYDPNKTADLSNAKWRSLVAVSPESTVGQTEINGSVFWVMLPSNTKIVFISDYEYQVRFDDPVGDREIKYSNTYGSYAEYRGDRFVVTSTFNADNFAVNETNPNTDLFSISVPFPKPKSDPEFIQFAETRLELGYDYGVVGGPEFATEIVTVSDEREQRNAVRCLPLGRWQLGDRIIADTDDGAIAEVTYLNQFHKDRKGCFEGFRFKDWADYKATDQLIAVGDGTKTHFQLRKGYWAGEQGFAQTASSEEASGAYAPCVTYRPIQKPVEGTVKLYVNGNEVDYSNWIIDHINGVVSASTALPKGARLRANYEFDIPVWFEKDQIGFKLEGYDPSTGDTFYKLESVFVVEGKIPLNLPWSIDPAREITEELNLGIVYETSEQKEFSTKKLKLKNGYELRQPKRDDTRLYFNFGDRNFDQKELDTLLGYFWNAKGRAFEFPIIDKGNNYSVRFNSDRLNIKFEAANQKDALYKVTGIKLKLSEQQSGRLNQSINFSYLYGHYTFLETAPNGDLYNYRRLGKGRGIKSGSGRAWQALKSTDKAFKSTVYGLFSPSGYYSPLNYYRFKDLPFNQTTENGFSLLFTGKIPNTYRADLTRNGSGTKYSLGTIQYELSDPPQWLFGDKRIDSAETFDRLEFNSYALVFTFNEKTQIYVNGVLDAEVSTINPDYSPVEAELDFDIFADKDSTIGFVEWWNKALSAEEIALLHPNGVRSPLRSATPKDTGIGHEFIITAEDDAYGYTSNTSGALSPITPLNSTQLPQIINRYLVFGSETKLEISRNFNTIDDIFTVVNFNDATEGDLFFLKGNNEDRAAGYIPSSRSIGYFTIIDNSSLYTQHAIPESINLSVDLEVAFVGLSVHEVYINGLLCTEILNISTSESNKQGNSFVGANAQGAASFNGRIKTLFAYDLLLMANQSYTLQNNNASRVARIFYQMGFKKSLTALEPTNPRLLAGDYPI